MFWFGKKKTTTDEARSGSDQALPLHDPRTRVQTTSAATSTTNTVVQNATIFDNNKNTVTYKTTRQTVTHTQQAHLTEMVTRRTPNQKELDELFAQMNMNSGGMNFTTSTTTSSKRGSNPSSLFDVSLRSKPSFKPNNAEARRSSTLARTEQTTMSQKQGRSVTQHEEAKRLLLNPTKKYTWQMPTTTTTTTNSATTEPARTTKSASSSALSLKPLDRTYISPYANKSSSVSSLSSIKPIISTPKSTTSNSTVKPSVISTPRTTGIANTSSRLLSTSRVSPAQEFISINPPSSSTGAVPKLTVSSRDARCELKPTTPIIRPPTLTGNKKKLKPAEVVIFNHEKFDNQNEFRTGSAEDVQALKRTFKALKCNVRVILNATLKEVRSNVRKLEQENFSDRSALVLVLLSHGQRHDTLAARDGDYKLDDDVVFPIVRNRTLQDKPKILFVQACKGSREVGGLKTDSVQPHGVPSEILKCYSTYEGYVSYRQDDGTPFIRMLCETLSSKPNVDIATIMEEVRFLVKACTKDSQIPTVTTTLTSKYVFGDYT